MIEKPDQNPSQPEEKGCEHEAIPLRRENKRLKAYIAGFEGDDMPEEKPDTDHAHTRPDEEIEEGAYHSPAHMSQEIERLREENERLKAKVEQQEFWDTENKLEWKRTLEKYGRDYDAVAKRLARYEEQIGDSPPLRREKMIDTKRLREEFRADGDDEGMALCDETDRLRVRLARYEERLTQYEMLLRSAIQPVAIGEWSGLKEQIESALEEEDDANES